MSRIEAMKVFEKKLKKKGFKYIAGIDEAGRGPLAGPVVAAACMLEEPFFIKDLNDSKKIIPARRKEIYQALINSSKVVYSVAIVEAEIIDEINILNATLKAMEKAVNSLKIKPQYLLIDGNQLPKIDIPKEGIIKGDNKSVSIAAASIIAKEIRDALMKKYHQKWPEYNFVRHKGYGTKEHKETIKKHGICAIHRRSFEPIKSMLHFQKKHKNKDEI